MANRRRRALAVILMALPWGLLIVVGIKECAGG